MNQRLVTLHYIASSQTIIIMMITRDGRFKRLLLCFTYLFVYLCFSVIINALS